VPIYEYKAESSGCSYCKDGFEVTQSFSDEPFATCPKCGAKVRKVVSGFSVGKPNILSNENLKRHGFSKLKRVDKGTFEKEV